MSDEMFKVSVSMSEDRDTRKASFYVIGFWPKDTVAVTKCRGEASEVNWSTGGRNRTIPPLEAARNIGNAILAAVQLAKEWDK